MNTNRREFLRFSVGSIIALPAGMFLVQGCAGDGYGSEDDTGTPSGDTPAAPPAMMGTQVVYTTNVYGDHSHTFGIETTAFASPSEAGVSGSTSSAENHTHTVAVAMADLQYVQAGQTVKITTGTSAGHTHVLTLVKLS